MPFVAVIREIELEPSGRVYVGVEAWLRRRDYEADAPADVAFDLELEHRTTLPDRVITRADGAVRRAQGTPRWVTVDEQRQALLEGTSLPELAREASPRPNLRQVIRRLLRSEVAAWRDRPARRRRRNAISRGRRRFRQDDPDQVITPEVRGMIGEAIGPTNAPAGRARAAGARPGPDLDPLDGDNDEDFDRVTGARP